MKKEPRSANEPHGKSLTCNVWKVTLEACGADGETAAIAACADKPLARWELLPSTLPILPHVN